MLRVAIVYIEFDKGWVHEILEWSRPMPRIGERLLFAPDDYADADNHEAVVSEIYWPICPTDTVDVFIAIKSAVLANGESAMVTWLESRGFRELRTALEVEEFDGLPGLAKLLTDYDSPDESPLDN